MKKKNKYYFQLRPWHFIIALAAFFLLTIIVSEIQLRKIPGKEHSETSLEPHEAFLDDKIRFVFFYDENSDLCKKQRQNIELLAMESDDEIGFYEINLNENPHYSYEYNISGVPNILVFKGEEELFRIMGMVSFSNLQLIYSNLYNKYVRL